MRSSPDPEKNQRRVHNPFTDLNFLSMSTYMLNHKELNFDFWLHTNANEIKNQTTLGPQKN